MIPSLAICVCALSASSSAALANGVPSDSLLTNKTLVAWVAPANLTQRGGSVLTIEDRRDRFDGIVFGEIRPAVWMAGSDFYLPCRLSATFRSLRCVTLAGRMQGSNARNGGS